MLDSHETEGFSSMQDAKAGASDQTASQSSAAQALDLHQAALDHLWIQSAYPWSDAIAPGGVVIMEHGQGSTITDVDGHSVLDFASGLWLANVGFGRSEIADAMAAQARKLHYTRHQTPTEAT